MAQTQEEEEIEEEPEEIAPPTTGGESSQSTGPVDDDVMEISSQNNPSSSLVTVEHINSLADKIKTSWESLALGQLDIEADDIEYVKTDKDTDELRAHHILTLWKVCYSHFTIH